MSDFPEDDLARMCRCSTLVEIDALEKRQARALREYTIGRGGTPAELKARLEAIDDQIAELRSTLP